MATYPKIGFFWNKRSLTYDEAYRRLNDIIWVNQTLYLKAAGAYSRMKELYSSVEKEAVSDIRISDELLIRLKEYL